MHVVVTSQFICTDSSGVFLLIPRQQGMGARHVKGLIQPQHPSTRFGALAAPTAARQPVADDTGRASVWRAPNGEGVLDCSVIVGSCPICRLTRLYFSTFLLFRPAHRPAHRDRNVNPACRRAEVHTNLYYSLGYRQLLNHRR